MQQQQQHHQKHSLFEPRRMQQRRRNFKTKLSKEEMRRETILIESSQSSKTKLRTENNLGKLNRWGNLCYAHLRALLLIEILEQPMRLHENEHSLILHWKYLYRLESRGNLRWKFQSRVSTLFQHHVLTDQSALFQNPVFRFLVSRICWLGAAIIDVSSSPS